MEQLLENIQMDRDFPFLFYRFHYDENTAFSYYHYHNYIEITLVWNGAIEYSFEDGTKVRAGAGDIGKTRSRLWQRCLRKKETRPSTA